METGELMVAFSLFSRTRDRGPGSRHSHGDRSDNSCGYIEYLCGGRQTDRERERDKGRSSSRSATISCFAGPRPFGNATRYEARGNLSSAHLPPTALIWKSPLTPHSKPNPEHHLSTQPGEDIGQPITK